MLNPAPALYAVAAEPCRCLALALLLFACEIIFLLIFSGLFYHTLAQDALYHLYADFALAKVCLSLGFFLILALLLLDVEGWHKRQCLMPAGKYIQPWAYFIAAGLFVLGAFLSAERYPAYPLAVCIGLFPFVAFVGKRLLFDPTREAAKRGETGRLTNEQALSLISLIFAAIALSSFFAWIGWLASNGFWGCVG